MLHLGLFQELHRQLQSTVDISNEVECKEHNISLHLVQRKMDEAYASAIHAMMNGIRWQMSDCNSALYQAMVSAQYASDKEKAHLDSIIDKLEDHISNLSVSLASLEQKLENM